MPLKKYNLLQHARGSRRKTFELAPRIIGKIVALETPKIIRGLYFKDYFSFKTNLIKAYFDGLIYMLHVKQQFHPVLLGENIIQI